MQSWEIIAHVIEKAILHTQQTYSQEKLTVFHSRKAPSISIYNYIARIHDLALCSESCYIMAFIYIDRVLQKNPGFALDSLSIHRLILASIFIAIKFHDDIYYNNEYYAKVGGISVEEMNFLEIGILSFLQFDLFVHPQVYSEYVTELSTHCVQIVQQPIMQAMEIDKKDEKLVPRISSNASIDTTPSSEEFPDN